MDVSSVLKTLNLDSGELHEKENMKWRSDLAVKIQVECRFKSMVIAMIISAGVSEVMAGDTSNSWSRFDAVCSIK